MDDWLRLKNLRKIINKNEIPDKQADLRGKNLVSIQELLQYKLQFKPFTST
jgi:hypothetical protein